jgi:ElaB/YqjD/DUF883 family membrane-anchored ribosome-binding protein
MEDAMAVAENGVEAHAQDVREDVKALSRDVKKLAEAVGAQARDKAEDFAEEVQSHTTEAYRSLKKAVKEKPGVALGIAAGAGMIVA